MNGKGVIPMKYNNIQWIVRAPFYVRKTHFCPECGTQVLTVKRDKIVRSGSEEAKRLGASHGNFHSVSGECNVKVIWKEFECPQCRKYITIDEMKHHEGIPK